MRDWRIWAWLSTAIIISSIAGCQAVCEKAREETKREAMRYGYEQTIESDLNATHFPYKKVRPRE